MRYTDPTGHVVANDNDGGVSSKGCLPSELACQVEKSERYKRHKEKQRQDELFQLIFSGSASDGSWTYTDQYRYYTNRSSFWGQPESWDRNGAKGWELFASQASQLAAAYSPAARDEFVRDFGLAFAGIPSQSSFVSAAFGVKNGPGQLTFLNYSNDGLLSKYLDKNSEGNQSHHYAGLFVLGYFAGSNSATVVNVMRDLDNPGDIALGNVAAEHGGSFAMTGAMSQINQLISSTGP